MAFEELKRKQSAMWGSAPFERVAAELTDIHDDLVVAIDPQPGESVLDVACGTGGIAERVAQRGADVTGIDEHYRDANGIRQPREYLLTVGRRG